MPSRLFDSREYRYKPIENYGLIGNLKTAALVGMDGSIDFMCFPRFDSPTVFAAMLDYRKGGRFRIAPVRGATRQKQLYYPNTNILLTRFLFDDGVGEVSDFMPITHGEYPEALVRQVKCVRGSIRFSMICAPRFDYGRADMQAEKREGEVIFMAKDNGGLAFRLCTTIPCEIRDGAAIAEFDLHAGESATFIFEEATHNNLSRASASHYGEAAFDETSKFWDAWISKSSYKGRWRETVDRSALTLKLLTSETFGTIIAAPTFSLPELLGGGRNWDYRFTWIRDASFTLDALMKLGFTDEAAAFMRWLEARCLESEAEGSLQIMYGIDGRHDLKEETLPHLEGYMKSAPVRIGNGAADQLQLDIYGELMNSVYLYNQHGHPISDELWRNLSRMTNWVCNNWRQADEGIWEVRGGRKEFLYSRVMCWVAIDRAMRLADARSLPAPLAEWHKVRDGIYEDVFQNFWSASKQSFVQHKSSEVLDAANLIMPLVHFVSETDPKWLSTLAAVEKELVSDSLVYRYKIENGASDGLDGEEGTFCMCSFWYVENLAMCGQLEHARFLFEKMLGYANHLGLYSEELGPRGEHLGNMPQAFTHVALIGAAQRLNALLERSGDALP